MKEGSFTLSTADLEILKHKVGTEPAAELSHSAALPGRTHDEPRSYAVERLQEISPLEDSRWDALVRSHQDASLFHSKAWLTALRDTYGYEPVAFTTSSAGQPLSNALLFCKVRSWLTGQRLVSLPFADYCEVLCRQGQDPGSFADGLEAQLRNNDWRYIELRDGVSAQKVGRHTQPFVSYTLHRLDLRPDISTIFRNFHKDSIQRKIRRAEREGLAYVEGSTELLFETFYRLLVLTRRRHCVPPQPRKWFRKLMECFGDDLKIRVALKRGRPIASIITIRYKDTLYYKYGGSDARFHNLGSMQLLYWNAIQDAKGSGVRVFDLGRTDLDQAGLITFKSRWGATVSPLTYIRISLSGRTAHPFEPGAHEMSRRVARSIFAYAPPRFLPALGAILYRHIG